MKEKKRPTLKDVAQEAGVSFSMVSHVLNNYPSIRETTRQRVWDARQKLGYQPNLHARTLRASHRLPQALTRNIGLVIVESNPSYPIYMPLISSFSQELHQRDLHPLVLTMPTSIKTERDLPASLRDRNMDGFLLIGALSEDLFVLFDSLGLPYVIVGNEVAGSKRSMVKPDVATGVAEGMDLLFGLGHTEIGLVAERLTSCYHQEILSGFRGAYAQRGLELRDEWIQSSGRINEGGYAPMERLLRIEKVPSAILFTNIRVALNALNLMRQRDFEIPVDVSLLTFSGTDESENFMPIDRMVVDYAILGTVAVKTLLERVADPATPCLTVSVPCSYCKGSTCVVRKASDSASTGTGGGDATEAVGCVRKAV